MTEIDAQKKLDKFMLGLNAVWEKFEGDFFDGLGLYRSLGEMEEFIKRFRAEIKERNGDGTSE